MGKFSVLGELYYAAGVSGFNISKQNDGKETKKKTQKKPQNKDIKEKRNSVVKQKPPA